MAALSGFFYAWRKEVTPVIVNTLNSTADFDTNGVNITSPFFRQVSGER
jgi:hypothetical protein